MITLKKITFTLLLISNFLILKAQESKRSVFVKKINTNITIDGKLDEDVWLNANSANSFWQQFPTDSIRSFNKSDVKILYNDTHLFIGADASSFGGDFIVNSLRRDFSARNNDNVTLVFDTFQDGQNAFLFGVSAFGVQREALVSDRGINISGFNLNWDVKWESKVTRYNDRFVVEIAIPFSSVKYPDNSKKWGFQAYRYDLQTNERTIWSRVPQNLIPINIGFFGELVFEEPLKKTKSPIYIIPYINSLTSKKPNENIQNSLSAGGDIKLAIGNGLNLDVTINPDFSNVEVDNIVTNLTRFEISLPEKRQFFIDNGDLFSQFGSSREASPFFSRRIGIARDADGNTIQNRILGGIRLSGKINKDWRLGILSVQNEEDFPNEIASYNNSMFAIQRKVFDQSQVGVFMINKESFKKYDFLKEGDKFNRVIGIDYNLASSNNKWIGKFYTHKSFQNDDNTGNISSQANLIYNTRIWRFSSDLVYIDEDFRSDLGFIPRRGVFKSRLSGLRNFYPKTGEINSHRISVYNLMYYQQSLDYKKTDQKFQLDYSLEFKDQSRLGISYNKQYIFLSNPFDPTRSNNAEPLPSQLGYNFGTMGLNYTSNYAQVFSYSAKLSYGTFFNGNRFSISGNSTYRIQPKVVLSLLWDYNKIDLPKPYASADLILISPKIDLTLTKKFFWSTLVQYSNQQNNLGINSRIQWRFAPLSDLYLVYNDSYNTGNMTPIFRSINLKITYWINL